MTTTTITVSTSAQLYDALSHATGGETIKLATGNYGNLNLTSLTFPSNVTIMSERPMHPATFTGMNLSNVSNLTVGGVVFDYTFKSGDQLYTAPFSINGGSNITIRNSTFDGDVASGLSATDNGYATATGLSISRATNVHVTGNEFTTFSRGLVVSNTSAITVSGNDVHDVRTDGMDFAQVQGVAITGNHIHDFVTSPLSDDHPDMIQFSTAGTTAPSTDITISGNLLDIGNGAWTQSIFMGNELASGGGGTSTYYRNVTISDNVIANGHYHGITVGQTIGVTVTNNTVVHSDGNTPDGADAAVEIPQININPSSTGVTVSANITSAIDGYSGQSGWVVSGNALVQDQNPNGANYYGDIFITSSLTSTDGVHTFLALPGSLIDTLGAGAAATRDYLPEPGAVAALFEATQDAGGSVQTRTFDAGLSLTSLGTLPEGTTFKWNFGDGTSATGVKVVHSFATGGHYDVTLTVTLPTGVTDSVAGTIAVQDRDLITLGSDGNLVVANYEDVTTISTGAYGSTAGIQLGATGTSVSVASSYIADLTEVKDFDIAMKLKADSTTSSGEVFRINGSIVASVESSGKLLVQAFDGTGHLVQLYSTGTMSDLKAHAVDIVLHDGSLQLWVDGKMSSSAAFSGAMYSYGATDMTFGNPWGARNFLGDVTAFAVKVGESALTLDKTILSMSADGTFPGVSTTSSGAPASGTGLHLGDGVAAKINAGLLKDLLASSDFDVSMRLTSDTQDAKGNIFHLNGSLRARFNDAGEFVVLGTDANGKVVRVATTGLDLTDMKAHDLDVRLTNGVLQLWVDGTMEAHKAFSGSLHDPSGSALAFGFSTSATVPTFHGDMTAFDITIAADNGWAV